MAQERKAQNKLLAKRSATHDFLLRCMIKCGCGRGMYGAAGGHVIGRYRCSARGKIGSTCHAPTVSADALEVQVWQALRGFFSDLEQLARELRIAQQEELNAQEPKRAEFEAVQVNIRHVEREADEIAVALPKAKGKVLESLIRQQDEVNARYDAMTKRQAELEAELATRQLTDSAVDDILTYAHDVREGIENATQADKRRILELLQVKLTVKDSHYYARCLLGEWTEKVLERSELERVRSEKALKRDELERDTLTNTTPCWSCSAK